MANKKQLLKLADFLEIVPANKVCMGSWANLGDLEKECATQEDMLHTCGTTACLAGWAVIANGYCVTEKARAEKKQIRTLDIADRAARRLGLTYDQQQALFYRSGWPKEFQFQLDFSYEQGKKLAIARVRHMAETGE